MDSLGPQQASQRTRHGLKRPCGLQRLPSNVRVVLASTPDATSLDELAQLADRVMDAAPIAGVNPGLPTEEVEQLRTAA